MNIARWLAQGLAIFAACASAAAWARTPNPLFAADTPLHIVIRGPIAGLAKNKAPVDATLAVVGDAPETLPVQISARGITRRRHEICAFPPIKVGFPAKPGPNSLFVHQKELKLVTHCNANGGEQFELLELAAYRIYEVMTPVSFKTRLATIDYVGPDGQLITTRAGFFLEDYHDVAWRNDLAPFKTTARVPSIQISAEGAARFALFEYMISNLDWAMNAGPVGVQCCHNARLLGAPGAPSTAMGLIPVPRDFDLAGLVDAPYATPPDGIDVSDVRQRLYRGYCRTNNETRALAAQTLEQRASIMAVLDGVPGLDEKQKLKAQAYLARFFDKIATPEGVTHMMETCLG